MAGQGESKASKRRVEARLKQRRAMEMRLAGASYQKIADELGYSGTAGSYKAVMSAMDETIREPAEKLRPLELDRLDGLLETWYPLARAGDEKAADIVLKIQARRARLLGLDAPESAIVLTTGVEATSPTVSALIQRMLGNPDARLASCELAELEEAHNEGSNEQAESGDGIRPLESHADPDGRSAQNSSGNK